MSWHKLFCCWLSCEDPTEAKQPSRGQNNKSFKTTVVAEVMDEAFDHQHDLKKYIGQVEGYAFRTAADIIQSQHQLIKDLKRERENNAPPSAPTLSTFNRTFEVDFEEVNRSRQDFIASGNLLRSDRPPQLQEITQISLSYS